MEENDTFGNKVNQRETYGMDIPASGTLWYVKPIYHRQAQR